ncbi:hypothetical protein OS493_001928 [Desmophyllum pertusum]|uniref:STING transmembrane domain-containing protein n=1 Tax=Desmophyllum pertusum TaxID=174260 RepID=A0A9W9Z584_9CNID|nr:hypothetical protein OS493_001928 [Desmophyllum pertusum]
MADQPRENAVAQQENNGFGPLSKPRGRAATIASVVVAVISGVVFVFAVREKESKEGIHFLVIAVALLTLSFIVEFVGELVRRTCLITEEFKHKKTRYQGKWRNVFNSTFGSCGRGNLIFAVASILIVCYAFFEHYEVFSRPDYAILFSLNCFLMPQLLFLVGLRELSAVETSEINERKNKNVADGLPGASISVT